jgi:hypothetical protein
MRKFSNQLIPISLAVIAITVGCLSPAQAAIKAGSTCSSLGKVLLVGNQKLTCVKSGKKMVWGKTTSPASIPQSQASQPTPVVSPSSSAPMATHGVKYQSEGCHAMVSATLQKQVGTNWVDVAPASNWEKVASCDADHPYEPSVVADIPDGTVIRWHVYSPGNWDWFSTIKTVRTLIVPTMGVKIAAIPSEKYQDVAAVAQKSVTTDMPSTTALAPVTYTFEDSIFPFERTVLQNGVNSALSHFSPFLDTSQSIHIFVFGTSQFLKTEAPKADPGNAAFADDMARQSLTWGNRSSANCMGMGGFAVPEVPFPLIAVDAPCKSNDPAAAGVLPHELTHTLQFAFGKANSRCWAPTWLVEGQAQVGATALAYDENGPASTTHRKSWVDRIVKPNSVSDILAMEGETKDFSEYTLGAALSEYLVAKGGWMRSLNLYSQASKQVTDACLSDKAKMENFDKAFQSLYGETLSDFYLEALPYLQWLADHR